MFSLPSDLELEHSNHPFHKTLQLMVLSSKVLVAKNIKLKTVKTVIVLIIIMSSYCDLDFEDSKPIFPHDSSPHDGTPLYQVWLHMFEQFKDSVWKRSGDTERQTHTLFQSNNNTDLQSQQDSSQHNFLMCCWQHLWLWNHCCTWGHETDNKKNKKIKKQQNVQNSLYVRDYNGIRFVHISVIMCTFITSP